MVDTQDLVLSKNFVKLDVEGPCRRQIVPERLLDHHSPPAGETGAAERCYNGGEERGWDLEVKQGCGDLAKPFCQLLVQIGVCEVPLEVGKPPREAVENFVFELFIRRLKVLPHCRYQMLFGPVVFRYPDDGALQLTCLLKSVERAERHLAGKVTGDAKNDQGVSRP